MQTIFLSKDIPDLVAQQVIPLTNNKRIFLFYGPMGTGKTTVIKEVLHQLGVGEIVASPTFGYVNSYLSPLQRKVINHFDLYRMGSAEEFIAAGFDEILNDSQNICFIEWPQIIEEVLGRKLLNKEVCKIILGYAQKDPLRRSFIIKSDDEG